MPSTLIFGGSGKVARHLTRLLAAEGNVVHSIIRNPDQKNDIESLGAHPIVQSIEEASVDDFVETIRSVRPDVVVWAAGAGGGNPERTKSVDELGAIKAMDALAKAGHPKRYITISAIDVRDRTLPAPSHYTPADHALSERVWTAIQPYMAAKFAADKNLVVQNPGRGLEYTIVRPGGLSDEPGKGTVAAGKVSLGERVSREDVARVVVECIGNDGTKGLAVDVVGGDMEVREAVRGVVERREDGFEGMFSGS